MRGPALVGVGWPMPTAPESLGARGVALIDLLRPLVDLASVLVERESEPIVLVVLESSVERALSCFAVIPAKREAEQPISGRSGVAAGQGGKGKDAPTYLLAREPTVMLAWAAALASADVLAAATLGWRVDVASGVWRDGGGIPPCEGVDRPEMDGVARPVREGVAERPEMDGVARPLSRTELRDEATEAGRGTLPGPPTVAGSRRA